MCVNIYIYFFLFFFFLIIFLWEKQSCYPEIAGLRVWNYFISWSVGMNWPESAADVPVNLSGRWDSAHPHPNLCRSPPGSPGSDADLFPSEVAEVEGGQQPTLWQSSCSRRGRFIVWVVLSRVDPGQTVWRWCSVSFTSLFGCWWTNAAVTVAASEKDRKAFQYHVHPRISWTV